MLLLAPHLSSSAGTCLLLFSRLTLETTTWGKDAVSLWKSQQHGREPLMLRSCLRSGSGCLCSFCVRKPYRWFLFAVGGRPPCSSTGYLCNFYLYSKPTCQEWPVWWKLGSFPCQRYLHLRKKLFVFLSPPILSIICCISSQIPHEISPARPRTGCHRPNEFLQWLGSLFVHGEHQNAVSGSGMKLFFITDGEEDRAVPTSLLGNAKIILELFYQKSTVDHPTVWHNNSANVLQSSLYE